ncbi:MAG: ArsR family transcriptional regulator [Dehalococcoidia bacterium]|nr:ArsR family transcriptional regulator [Dehalococcoidia bacterium]
MAATLAPADWKFFTNHALVLGWIASHPQSTAREIAMAVSITERTALKIVGDLDAEGFIERRRKGRRNIYRVNLGTPLRRHFAPHVTVGDLLTIVAPKRKRGAA